MPIFVENGGRAALGKNGLKSAPLGYIETLIADEGKLVEGWLKLIGFCVPLSLFAALMTYFCPDAAGSGIPMVKAELNGVRVPGALTATTLAVKVLGVTLVVAAGLPCGREGPMVQLGAGVACIVLRAHNRILSLGWCRSARTEGRVLDEDRDVRNFVSLGAAAGVAAAFDAPIGGVLFALEEVSTHWSPKLTWLAFGGALVSDGRREIREPRRERRLV